MLRGMLHFGFTLTAVWAVFALLAVGAGQIKAAASSLLFVSWRGAAETLHLLDMERGILHDLFSNGDFPARAAAVWSPNHTQIAFVSGFEIYVINADGSGLRNISNHPEADWFPAWSPDGKQIAFVSHRDLNQEIYVADLESGDLYNISNHPNNDTLPAWSPDGDTLAFQSLRRVPGSDYPGIYTVSSSGGEARRLTDYCGNLAPAWTADGTAIMFCSFCSGIGDVYTIGRDGRGLHRLTTGKFANMTPTYSPDGLQITFASNRSETREIYVMDADGTNVRRMTDNDTLDLNPVWTASGQQITFVSQLSRKRELFGVPLDGGEPRRLTFLNADEIIPALYSR